MSSSFYWVPSTSFDWISPDGTIQALDYVETRVRKNPKSVSLVVFDLVLMVKHCLSAIAGRSLSSASFFSIPTIFLYCSFVVGCMQTGPSELSVNVYGCSYYIKSTTIVRSRYSYLLYVLSQLYC